ncbi:MAG: 2-amino-4-hydroxy-6-hydroxymethyldihydropteridine diphosphokinase [Methylococcales bacterium]|nr:2-amino-4-hydroxy-6-hydroxymethyldihydropteridine diphosphokinase [Methylococcales bacterium]
MPTGYISIGSNIEREHNVRSSLIALEDYFGQLIISSVYESEAVGFSGNFFYNLIVAFKSTLDVTLVAKQLREIELAHGRTRNSQKFSARTLDLDLILYGDLVLTKERLQIPRDEIERYAFVLEPLAEIAANLLHPISKKSYADLWCEFDKTNLKQHKIDLKLTI